jgi:hypothetical protein
VLAEVGLRAGALDEPSLRLLGLVLAELQVDRSDDGNRTGATPVRASVALV